MKTLLSRYLVTGIFNINWFTHYTVELYCWFLIVVKTGLISNYLIKRVKSHLNSYPLSNTSLRRRGYVHSLILLDNIYEFKQDFTPLLDNYYIKPVITKIKNAQANAPVERMHQVILNMIVAKDLSQKVFEYIDS